jgi:hypothetical protein
MHILENSLVSGIFLVLNFITLGLSLTSYFNKRQKLVLPAMLSGSLLCLIYFFLCSIWRDIFILSVPHDFTANLFFFAALLGASINNLVALKIYYQHRSATPTTIQLAIFFSSLMIVTQVSGSVYSYYHQQKKIKELIQAKGFNPTDDFEKKARGSVDSVKAK